MKVYDVFNGDADGICSLIQLRRKNPQASELVTGVKRDIQLLAKIHPDKGDSVNALDISMDKNKEPLLAMLERGVKVFYCDHHVAGDIPDSESLDALISTAPDVCTSLLVNSRLDGAYKNWAITGAFGDNLDKSAQTLAAKTDLSGAQLEQLKNLGIYVNYNGYGSSLDDLHFTPADLYKLMSRYDNPLDFIADDRASFTRLESGYNDDMAQARGAKVLRETANSQAVLLPDEKWARRVSGVYGNAMANENPDRAHAVLTDRPDGTYLVSVRAPLNNKQHADTLCMEFPTGGGRKAAAGVNALPADMLDQFIDRLEETYS